MHIRNNQSGIGTLGMLIVAGVIFLVGLAGYSVFAATRKKADKAPSTTPVITGTDNSPDTTPAARLVHWSVNADGTWKPEDPNPPACPVQPMMQAPMTLANLKLVQYPGQIRGGYYKTYGTLTYNGVKNDEITIDAPMDAAILRGAKYMQDGETLYTFDLVNSCGVMYRLGRLRTLSSDFEAAAKGLQTVDDRTMTAITGDRQVLAGDRIATSIGTAKAVSFDFGVYDLRAPNTQSQNAAYLQQNGRELAGYGVCWFDYLPPDAASAARKAAAIQESALRKSDYCPSSQ